MPETISNKSTDPLPQPSIDGRLSNIEKTVNEILAVLKQVLAEQVNLKQEAKDRYVDLRERISLNNDKLSVIQRELHQLIKDTENPPFPYVSTR